MVEKEKDFDTELTTLLNKYCIDSALNIPDYILSEIILDNLTSLKTLTENRDKWFGFEPFKKEPIQLA